MTTTLDDLIARLEKAEGPDRKVDLAISLAINYRSAFDEVVRAVWSPMADDIEVFDAQGRRGFLDPAQFVPLWTRSIDAALTLVPKGWRWAVGKQNVSQHGGRHYDGPYATCWHPTAGPKRSGIAFGCEGATPAIALLTAFFTALKALKARQTEAR